VRSDRAIAAVHAEAPSWSEARLANQEALLLSENAVERDFLESCLLQLDR